VLAERGGGPLDRRVQAIQLAFERQPVIVPRQGGVGCFAHRIGAAIGRG
jgi:hypothetical protein